MRRSLKIMIPLLAVAAVILFINHIPMDMVASSFSNPQSIQKLYVEIDGTEDQDTSFTVTDRAEITAICDRIKDTSRSYRGPYAGIEYGESEDDFIIIIHINDPNHRIYLKTDGSFYNARSRFQDRGSNVSALCAYITDYYNL